MKILKIITLLLTMTGFSASANTYYISTTGDNANPGTIDLPWRNIQYACNRVKPGDTIYMRGGLYRDEQVTLSRSGTSDNWIVFRNYPGEKPVLQFSRSMNKESDWIDQGNNLWYTANGSFSWEVNHDVATIWHDGESNWSYKKYDPAFLQKQWDFYHNVSAGRLEVYSHANPATLADSIEIPLDPGTTQNQFNLTCRADYIVWDGLWIRYCNVHGMQVASGHHHVIFRNGGITHGGGGNVYPGRSPAVRWGDALDATGSVHHVIFENSVFGEFPDGTLTNQGSRGQQYEIYFRNNYIYNSTNGIHCWFGSTDESENENNWLKNIYYENNTFENIGKGWFEDQGVMQGGIQFNPRAGVSTSNIHIRNNTFINCGTSRFEAGTWKGVNCAVNVGGGDVIIAGNIIYGGESQGIEIHTTHQPFTGEIYNNLICETPWSGLRIDGDDKTPGVKVYNNTVVNCGDISHANVVLNEVSSGFEFFNNISYSTGSDELMESGNGEFSHNCYRSFVSDDSHSIMADPLFKDTEHHDYHLLPGSPCIDAGKGPEAPDYDLDSLHRPDGADIDIGAYEYPKPQILITSPPQDTVYIFPDPVSIETIIRNNKENVAVQLSFFSDDSLLGNRSSEPYRFTWNHPEPGDYRIHVTGSDSSGNLFHSKTIPFTVLPSQLPLISVVLPEENTEFAYDSAVQVVVDAADPDGSITRVQISLNNGIQLSDSTAPFSFSLVSLDPGNYALMASATDNTGQTVISDSIHFTVKEKAGAMEYIEDFSDDLAQDWSPVSGGWQVMNQQLLNYTNLPLEYTIYTGTTFALFQFSVRMKAEFAGRFGLIFNYQDNENYYMLVLNAANLDASLQIHKDDETQTIAQAPYPGRGTGNYEDVVVINNGSSTTVLINDDTIFNDLSTYEIRFGNIGLLTFYNRAWYDDIRVGADSAQLTLHAYQQPFESGYTAFPNPSGCSDHVSIRVPGDELPVLLKVYDLKGSVIWQHTVKDVQEKIDNTHLPGPGPLLLRFEGKHNSFTYKVIRTYD